MIDTARMKNAITRSKQRDPPQKTTAERKPRLRRFSEFLLRDENAIAADLSGSARLAPKPKFPEQFVQDDVINYIHSTIYFDGDDFKKMEAIDDISTALSEFVATGDVMIFAVCVTPE